MSDLPEQQQKVVDEAHAYRDAYNIREERREIYQMVAQAMLTGSYYQDHIATQTKDPVAATTCMASMVGHYAEAIYRGMIRFCGEGL